MIIIIISFSFFVKYNLVFSDGVTLTDSLSIIYLKRIYKFVLYIKPRDKTQENLK